MIYEIWLILLNFITYFPSFFHIPSGDQITYLAETSFKNDLFSLTLGSYDLNRTRVFCPGDYLLFRPLHYILLGIEKYFFGYKFVYWQAVSFTLHLATIFLLLKLLLRIRRSIFAYLLTALFSVLTVNQMMVTWQHVAGYFIFDIALLIILYEISNSLHSADKPLNALRICGWSLMAALSYELGFFLILTLIPFIQLYFPRSKQKSFLLKGLLINTILYISLYVYSFSKSVPGHINLFSNASLTFNLLIFDFFHANLWWIFHGLFTTDLTINFPYFINYTKIVAKLHPLNILIPLLGFLAIALYGFMFRRSIQSITSKKIKLNALIIVIMIIYVILIISNRMQHDVVYLMKRSYYSYMYWLCLIVLLYNFLNFELIKEIRFYKIIKSASLFILIGLIVTNSVLVYHRNVETTVKNLPTYLLINRIDDLIENNKHKNNFSFYLPPDFPGNTNLEFLKKVGDPAEKKYSYIEALYLRYFNEKRDGLRIF